MRFAEIIGQEELKRHLTRSVDAGRVSHAQLFTGSAGYGSLALAVAYVQYLCCRHRHDGDSCGECPDCKQIEALAHPDLHLVFPVNKQGKKYYTDKYYTFTRNGKQIDFRDGYDYGDDLLYLICLRTFRYEFRNYLDHVDPACEYCGYRNMSPAQLSFYNKCLHFLGDAPYKDETIIVDGMNITDALNRTYEVAKAEMCDWHQSGKGTGFMEFQYGEKNADNPNPLQMKVTKDKVTRQLVLEP